MSLYYVISKCFAFVYLKGQIENKSHLKITSYKFIFYKRSETLLKNKKKENKQANKQKAPTLSNSGQNHSYPLLTRTGTL